MNTIKKFFTSNTSTTPTVQVTPEDARILEIHREWDKQRARATSPSEVAEIDAIFARAI